MSEIQRVLDVPAFVQEGVDSALRGTHMSDRAHPQGFTFCPYTYGSVERHNFLLGCESVYFGLKQ